MRLITFMHHGGGTPRLGALIAENRIVDLALEARERGATLPFDAHDMVSLIAAGETGLAAVRDLVHGRRSMPLALDSLRLLAPIPRPRKNIFCVGWNYAEHFKEGEKIRPHVKEMPEHPAFFSKAPTTVNGPFDDIELDPGVTQKLDWEVELGVIIGSGGKNIPGSEAMSRIFGYTVINDVSAREIQRRHGQQWFKGKSIDGTCPMGPWIATRDELDPDDLRIVCRVNGAIKQDSSTRCMYFKIPRLIAELSLGLTLDPGDILSTGTPEGVGHARTPPEFMRKGDVLESEIAGLGLIRNRIV